MPTPTPTSPSSQHSITLRLGGELDPFHMTFELNSPRLHDKHFGIWGFTSKPGEGTLGMIFREAYLLRHHSLRDIRLDHTAAIEDRTEQLKTEISNKNASDIVRNCTTTISRLTQQGSDGLTIQQTKTLYGNDLVSAALATDRDEKNRLSESATAKIQEVITAAQQEDSTRLKELLKQLPLAIIRKLAPDTIREAYHEQFTSNTQSDYGSAKSYTIQLTDEQFTSCLSALQNPPAESLQYFVFGQNCIHYAFRLLENAGVSKEQLSMAHRSLIFQESHAVGTSLTSAWMAFSGHRIVSNFALTDLPKRALFSVAQMAEQARTDISSAIDAVQPAEISMPSLETIAARARSILSFTRNSDNTPLLR
jgi:hypothetical protein